MRVEQIVPATGPVDLPVILGGLTDATVESLQPFSADIVDFCAEFSAGLFRSQETRGFPEIQALAFWMRKSELRRLKEEFESLGSDRTILVPRGLVFHVPPSNVDTIFIYSWLLSVLVGNRNVVRLSSRRSPQTTAICAVLNRLIASSASEALRRSTSMVTYGHDADVTRAISAISDVRVIWGGDQTVTAIRSLPLPAHAREVTFPDRVSFSLVDTARYLALSDDGRSRLAERFYNDAYWFDQMGCSSPRMIVWCGTAEGAAIGSQQFFAALRCVVSARGYAVETGTALNKLTYSYRAVLDASVTSYRALGNEVTLLTVDEMAEIPRDHCGAGLFYEARVDELTSVARFVTRRNQTITYFGFGLTELGRLGRVLNGRGVDRLVPIGQALTFNRFWDGLDLLQEMTRRVYVEPDTGES